MRARQWIQHLAPAAATATSVVAIAAIASSCKREERQFRVEPPAAQTIYATTLTDLHAGKTPAPLNVHNEYEENAYAIAEGQRLYLAYNCVGCHFHGGGGIGPPLMDATWVYGSRPEQIFSTIIEGRPNGMPSFRGKIPDYQVWQIVAYVRSLSGLVSKQAAPGRSDAMKTTTPPNSVPTTKPVDSSLPPSAEMPG